VPAPAQEAAAGRLAQVGVPIEPRAMWPSGMDRLGVPVRSPGPQPTGQRITEIVLIVLVFFSLTGDPPPNVNEAHYLCRLKHAWNPSWAAGDLFLESKDTQKLFIWMFGWVTRFVSLSATAWIGRFIAWTLLAWSWQRLSWRLIPRRMASVLSAALFVTFNEQLHLAGEWVVGGVEAKCFAYAFVLFALCNMLDRRWNRVWLLLGVATAFHPLVGGWSGVVCMAIWFINDRRMVSVASMLPGLTCGAIVSLPGILPALMLTWNEPPDIVAEANRIYVFERLPHHLAPLTLPIDEFGRRLAGHTALVAILATFIVVLYRSFADSGATGSASAFPQHNQSAQASRSRPETSLHLTSLNRIAQFAFGALALAAIGFAIEIALWTQPSFAALLLKYYWFRLTDFALPMAAALYATSLIIAGLNLKRAWAPWALALAIGVASLNIASATYARYVNPLPPAEQKIREPDYWNDACEWAAENTPADALFLTPRLNLTFKWRAGRPEVVNRKDLPQDARSIIEWNRRIKSIYYAVIEGEEQPLDSLGILGTEQVRTLALQNDADYVLMDRGQLLSLPIVYRNAEYVIYRIDRDDPRTSGDNR
jgi:hypothetical protein